MLSAFKCPNWNCLFTQLQLFKNGKRERKKKKKRRFLKLLSARFSKAWKNMSIWWLVTTSVFNESIRNFQTFNNNVLSAPYSLLLHHKVFPDSSCLFPLNRFKGNLNISFLEYFPSEKLEFEFPLFISGCFCFLQATLWIGPTSWNATFLSY